jgi:hypothetical protein
VNIYKIGVTHSIILIPSSTTYFFTVGMHGRITYPLVAAQPALDRGHGHPPEKPPKKIHRTSCTKNLSPASSNDTRGPTNLGTILHRQPPRKMKFKTARTLTLSFPFQRQNQTARPPASAAPHTSSLRTLAASPS